MFRDRCSLSIRKLSSRPQRRKPFPSRPCLLQGTLRGAREPHWCCLVSVSGYRLGADREARVRAGIQQPLPGRLTLLFPDNEPVRRNGFPEVLLLSDTDPPEATLNCSPRCPPQASSDRKCGLFVGHQTYFVVPISCCSIQ